MIERRWRDHIGTGGSCSNLFYGEENGSVLDISERIVKIPRRIKY